MPKGKFKKARPTGGSGKFQGSAQIVHDRYMSDGSSRQSSDAVKVAKAMKGAKKYLAAPQQKH